jgi:ABC-type sugar transport system substrate-binding protein
MKLQSINRRTAMLAMGASLVGAAFFGPVASASAAPARIAAIVQSLNSEYNVLWANAAQAHPALKDGTATLTILDGRFDALTQSNLFDTAITAKYDAIIFIPVDIDAGNDPVQRAIAAGIPVFGSNTLITKTNLYKSYINSNDVEAGQILAKSVIDKMGGKGNVVIIEGMIGQSAQVQRLQGIQKTLADNPNVKVLEMKTANWTRAESMSLTENWLTAHPGVINGIIAENDEEALGALAAVKGAGIDPKTIPIAGVDGVTDALLAVKRGEMMSTLQDADAQAKGAIDLALRAVIGNSYKPRAAVWDVNGGKLAWADGTAQHYYVPWVPVTQANVDSLLAMRKTQ